ncbi:hypothetical protein A1O3_02598 [Capronia epimyces CBS 606.96]|uniref:SAP domain-containing protein n=1 Tax=Capronia epimyces CBS 606.96 TaxID=1182542 RepID=W9YJV8_9EURO|nr:uncharacterized protein A1O3_02598 [Capronia epimyces CBS 606.96]EXJ89531.1 hypothetical protein A1O3_02598 [Capronia epimyces CBS 606.96]
MVDYAKKTVVELQEILKSRNLSHTGKKAELIARLNEADKAAEANDPAEAPPAESTSAPPEQQIEPAAPQDSENPAVTETAPVQSQVDATASPSANTDTALANSASYALNLPQSDIDAELARRKARAERFGTGAATANGETGTAGTENADDEAQKALERAKRFGTGQTAVGKLDEALPTEPERRSRKRNRTEESSALDDPALIRGFGGRGRGRGGRLHGRGGRDNSRRRTGEKPRGVSKQSGIFSSEADRLAAETRKKRFASAS